MSLSQLKSPLMLQYETNQGILYIFTSLAKKVNQKEYNIKKFQEWFLCKTNIKKADQKIADLYLFTETNVFKSAIFASNLNQDLTWNQKTFALLFQVLNGKKTSTSIKYNNEEKKLRISCQLQTKISVHFLQIKLLILNDASPFQYMANLFDNQKQEIEVQQSQINQQCANVKRDLRDIDVLQRKMNDDHYFDMEQRKNQFLPIANKIKNRVRNIKNRSIFIKSQQKEERKSLENRKIYPIKKDAPVKYTENLQQFEMLFDK